MPKSASRLLLALVLAGAIGLAFHYRAQLDAAAMQAWLDQAGPAAPLLFMLLYALATVLFLPGSVLTLIGGALFGPWFGTLWSLSGATLGAALAFLIARHLGADWVARHSGPRLGRLVDGVVAEGWRFVAFVRLVPLFPFNLLNYALGLTRIGFLPYLLATWVFMLPGALAYTWLGHAGRGALGGDANLIRDGLIALALLAAVAFLPRFVARLRRRPMQPVERLKARLDAGEDLLLLDVRPRADFTGELGHIAGALNLPLEDLAAHLDAGLDALGTDRSRAIALVCRTDRRSAKAAYLLAARGYTAVDVIAGGMTAWRERGWPVEEAAATATATRE